MAAAAPPAGGGRGQTGARAPVPASANLAHVLLAFVLIARAALLINNLPQLPRTTGFDSEAHEDYIRSIQQRHTLPSANEGWEMYQPPLYYAGSALLLGVCGLSLPDDAAVLLARTVNGVAGLLNCWLALLCLRRLFPGISRPRPQDSWSLPSCHPTCFCRNT